MIRIIKGDCIKSLKKLEDASINTCITSPPYWGLRNYNDEEKQLGLEDTPEEFVDNLVAVFKEVKRVLRDDGTVWLNLGDCYSPNKQLGGIPWRVALALQSDGWYLRQDIIWHKPNPMPESVKDRCTKAHEYIFLLSKSPKYYFDNEAIKEDSVFVNSKGEKGKPNSAKSIGKSTKDKDGFNIRDGFKNMGAYEKRNKRTVWTVTTKPFKGAHFATFPPDLIEPCVLAGCPEKICVGCSKPYKRVMQRPKQLEVERNKRSGLDDRKVGGVLDKYNRENPPIDLGVQKQCDCKTHKTKAGTVLDPFAGSGTTGIVAANNERNAVLLELNEGYINLAKERINTQVGLWAEVVDD